MEATIDRPCDAPNRRLWTREDYYRAAELGFFRPDERLELIGGEVIEKASPQKSRHTKAIRAVEHALEEIYGQGFDVRYQLPLALDDNSEPEPDVAVVEGSWDDFDEHPTTALLVVEISDTTLRTDRGLKASLYAQAGIPEYWIVNLEEGVLEVYREPRPDVPQPFDHSYASVTRLTKEDTVTPVTASRSIPVASLLP
jgi:Uma2 family endonuclease